VTYLCDNKHGEQMKNAQNTQTAQVVRFVRPARNARKAMQKAIENLGNTWHCITVAGAASFYFPETNTTVLVDRNDFSSFRLHLHCSDVKCEYQHTPENWH